MHFKGRMELEHGLKQIDIAPLIDVVFQLLIFFMLTSSFVIQPGIKVNLPKAVTSESVQIENMEIIVSGENVLYFNGKVVTMQELKNFLKQISKRGQSVMIKADRRASLGRVVEIWDLCRENGIKQLNIATNQE
ncbi:MAG: biopolymer transporter ExbD [Candidatus Omnitrophica bacterium]|jgi:biopolymer transport protein ExbD|nr:biopolymer transporter ExbD [Candidatus Omnitrophota bacterium]MDD5513587.1 biopolymer transporter ExbD [Candidatus Omnitrophota bacterium]